MTDSKINVGEARGRLCPWTMKQASRPVDKGEARPIFQYNRRLGGAAMLPKSVIVCLAASAVATSVLMPTGAAAVKGGPMPGTWNWPPYAGSGGGMPGKPICSYAREEHKPGKWVCQCH
jgi:hypothetical protein